MTSDGTHTLHRIDVKDQLPREGTYVLCWGHNKDLGWRWVDVLYFDGEIFVDEDSDEPGEFHHMVTHWAQLEPLNWNDGVPLFRGYIQ